MLFDKKGGIEDDSGIYWKIDMNQTIWLLIDFLKRNIVKIC